MTYAKDNPEGYWFKSKIYGWGWTPVTWQGWAVTFVALALIIGNGIRLSRYDISESEFAAYLIPHTIVIILVLIVICYAKGEKPRWQWGFPKENDNKKITFPK